VEEGSQKIAIKCKLALKIDRPHGQNGTEL
jgi:hypothetical protein